MQTTAEQFHLTIHLGNEAMQTPEDVAEALHRVAHTLEVHGFAPEPVIRDANGNTVGSVELEF